MTRALSASGVLLTGKKDVFPVAGQRARGETDDIGQEQPLLLNPCEDDPGEHLTFNINPERGLPAFAPDPAAVAAAAEAAGVSVRGAVSIQVYGLNRLGLVQERTRVLRHL